MPDLPALLFALTTLHAGYLGQLSFRQPSTRKITSPSETWPMYFAASPLVTSVARIVLIAMSAYHALLSLSLAGILPVSQQQRTCPQPAQLDARLFTWSAPTLGALAVLYVGSAVRLAAYRQLGDNFTYRIAAPDTLVTTGLYAYVRHPSYTGLLAVVLASHALFLRPHGFAICWAPDWAVDGRVAGAGTVLGLAGGAWLFMVRRVREEERMMEREFGARWIEYRAWTKKFVPFVV